MGRKPTGPTLPKTLRQLRLWLKQTVEGQQMLAELLEEAQEMRCRTCQAEIRPRPKVLVVARRLGLKPGAEVYAERGVSVRLEELFDTQGDTDLELAAEEVLGIRLPRAWQHLIHGLEGQPTRGVVFSGVRLAEYVRCLELENAIREIRSTTQGETKRQGTRRLNE